MQRNPPHPSRPASRGEGVFAENRPPRPPSYPCPCPCPIFLRPSGSRRRSNRLPRTSCRGTVSSTAPGPPRPDEPSGRPDATREQVAVPRLIVIRGVDEGKQFDLSGPTVSVGR